MKSTTWTIFALLTSFFLILSCSSDDAGDDDFIGTVEELSVSISSSEAYTKFLGEWGEDGYGQILVQAEHFAISHIQNGNYYYEPENDFTGTDYVEVAAFYRFKDRNGNDLSKNFKFKITIEVTPN